MATLLGFLVRRGKRFVTCGWEGGLAEELNMKRCTIEHEQTLMNVDNRQPIAVSDISIYICLIDIRTKSKEQLNERRAGLSNSNVHIAELMMFF